MLMTRLVSKLLIPTGVMALAAGCASSGTSQLNPAAAPPIRCATPDQVAASDRGLSDVPSDSKIAFKETISDWSDTSFDEAVKGYTATAVLQVEARLAPIARTAGTSYTGAAMSPTDRSSVGPISPSLNAYEVVRPVTFSTVRNLNGFDQPCVSLDVPGGVAQGVADLPDSFPDTLQLGDRVLTFFFKNRAGVMTADAMFKLDSDGRVHVPWKGGEGVAPLTYPVS